jgi:type I restriction enzyme, S subunit
MMGWPKKELGELADISRGSSPRPIADTRYFDGGTVPWVKIADATKSGKFLYETKQHVNDFGASFSRRLPPGTILVAASGTLGYTQILGVEGCAHDGWLILQNLRGLDRDFAYYALKTLERHFFNSGSGAAIQNINTDILRKTEIPFPPLSSQQRIAGILSAYDELIENSQRRIRILEVMARALYREWFVHFRFPDHENHPRVPSPLGEIPEGWEVVSFTDIADVLSGGTPKTSVDDYWNGNFPFFTPRDAPVSFYVQDSEKHITELGISKCSSELFPPDTVFITARGTVGKVALPSVPMAMNQSCYALRGKDGVPQRYLFLLTLQQVDYLKTNTGGATFNTIIVDTFRRMQVVMPPREVVAQFTRRVDAMFEQVNTLQTQVHNLRRTRDLLLPRLLSGQLELEVA